MNEEQNIEVAILLHVEMIIYKNIIS